MKMAGEGALVVGTGITRFVLEDINVYVIGETKGQTPNPRQNRETTKKTKTK
jgi:hypothetical protein